MKDELFSDEQLRAALERSQERTMDSLPQTPPRHEFSEAFQKNMNALFQKEKRTLRMRTAIRQVCAALLALVIGLSVVLTFNTEARAAVLLWFKEELGQYNIFWFAGDSSSGLPDCTIEWVPDGMECVSDESTDTDRVLVFWDPESPEEGFVLHYNLIQEGSALIVIDDDGNFQRIQVEINGCTGELYLASADGNNVLVWFDEKRNVALDITSPLDPEVILHIAESVVLSN